MDANKKRLLEEVNYRIGACCALCRHGEFSPAGAHGEWGTCQRFRYEHQKHSENPRQMSIVKYGACDGFERAEPYTTSLLGAFKEFLK
jgi:hypothetical protein